MKVYFDNTASTPLSKEVRDYMIKVMDEVWGNPSSVHEQGRKARVIIENSRKTIAKALHVSPSEIIFTSGGTEANNTAIRGAIEDLSVKNAITSPAEHHAVLHTLEHFADNKQINLHLLETDNAGNISLENLEVLLSKYPDSLVSLMYANNEISNLTDIEKVAEICRKYNAYLHSDMVQAIAHYEIDLKKTGVDFASSSAHKFHGPKGTGFLYINKDRIKINPLIFGGGQEQKMRGGTENIIGIAGLAKAVETGYASLKEDWEHILSLKKYMISELKNLVPGVDFLGQSAENGLYTVLSVLFPEDKCFEMLLNYLDINGIMASGGSACSSGTESRSHVLEAIHAPENRTVVRFSFCRYNTIEEIDYCIEVLRRRISKK